MKIGILTFHRSINNGAVLQCYSLSKMIKKDFPDCSVEVINYNSVEEEHVYDGSLFRYLSNISLKERIARILGLIFSPFRLRRMREKKRIFRDVLDVLPLSPDIIIDNGSKIYEYINARYDCLVVGSDAIWNFCSRGYPNPFLPGDEISIPKLSYAASCYGMDFINLDTEIKKDIADRLSNFSFLGVRDGATNDFVMWSNHNLLPVHTCDPTVLLDVDDLPVDGASICEKLKNRGFDFSKKTIAVMGNRKIMKMVKNAYGKDYQIVSLYNYLKGADIQLYDLSPYEWAYVFRFFSLTFTTYFHGTLLSLCNGVPVVCIAINTDFSKRHIPKTLDVLQRLDYEDWYFHTDYSENSAMEIKRKADVLLESDLHDEIISRIKKEAESYHFFKESLQRVINSRGKGND